VTCPPKVSFLCGPVSRQLFMYDLYYTLYYVGIDTCRNGKSYYVL
jgi:hypothetical protein